MRDRRLDQVLAGILLALIVAAPTRCYAAADQGAEPALAAQPAFDAPLPPDSDSSDIKVAPEPPLVAGDAQIADHLRAALAANPDNQRAGRELDRQAVNAFYAARSYAPLWIAEGQLNARATAAIARLNDAAADGLDARDYPIPEFRDFTDAEGLANDDIRLAYSVLSFARHLAAGRIAPTRVLAEVDYGKGHAPDPADILRTIANAQDEYAALESFNPPHAGFKALKAELAELRAFKPRADNRIADGTTLKPGMQDSRVPLLRARLHISGKSDDLVYDRKLANAIKRIQRNADLRPTGLVDARTLAAINGPKPANPTDVIVANMERWRWLPHDLGENYVMVNIPDFTLKVVHDHQMLWHTKIIAGKPQTPTPLASAAMDTVIVNPSWHVPQSIIQNELMPRYGRDPNIFSRMGLSVKRRPDGSLNVTQPPGAGNALGRIKFNFSNRFQVYLHDTPDKRLFAHDERAFSHGCMRVENPTKFGEIILQLAMNEPAPNAQQLSGLFGRGERAFKLTNRPMVYLTYQTAFIDGAGKLVLRDDLYGFDERIRAILRSDERRIADVTPPKDPKREHATAKSNLEILHRVERREALNPLSYFERSFR
jgi:L,D-transpeptidase YcbB